MLQTYHGLETTRWQSGDCRDEGRMSGRMVLATEAMLCAVRKLAKEKERRQRFLVKKDVVSRS
jgi:hypothetical protein